MRRFDRASKLLMSRLLLVKAARRMRRDGWNAGRVWLSLELLRDPSRQWQCMASRRARRSGRAFGIGEHVGAVAPNITEETAHPACWRHVAWAEKNKALDPVSVFLRDLREEDWHHIGE